MIRKNFLLVMLVFASLALFVSANSWAGGVMESVGFKDYTLFKFCEGEVDDWNQRKHFDGSVKWTCEDTNGGCHLVVNAIGICGSQDIRYDCVDGAKVTLLRNSVLLVPDDCMGDCGDCP